MIPIQRLSPGISPPDNRSSQGASQRNRPNVLRNHQALALVHDSRRAPCVYSSSLCGLPCGPCGVTPCVRSSPFWALLSVWLRSLPWSALARERVLLYRSKLPAWVTICWLFSPVVSLRVV